MKNLNAVTLWLAAAAFALSSWAFTHPQRGFRGPTKQLPLVGPLNPSTI
jgi:hypothetical protein